jgi:hypothetical protein
MGGPQTSARQKAHHPARWSVTSLDAEDPATKAERKWPIENSDSPLEAGYFFNGDDLGAADRSNRCEFVRCPEAPAEADLDAGAAIELILEITTGQGVVLIMHGCQEY